MKSIISYMTDRVLCYGLHSKACSVSVVREACVAMRRSNRVASTCAAAESRVGQGVS